MTFAFFPWRDFFRSLVWADVFQVIFNDLSAAEMAMLPKELQLELLAEFPFLPKDLENLDPERFGRVKRNGKALHRYRATDYRIYFSPEADRIIVHRVLHKNTIRDFLFRSNLPMTEEDEALGQAGGFWELIHEGQSRK